jgi:pyruvate formate lyase activating enzyme
METCKIYGCNRTSEAGPNNEAISIFLRGCNLRCPYCMNSKLVMKEKFNSLNEIPLEDIYDLIKHNEVKFVMISGGEPLFARDLRKLRDFIMDLRNGFDCRVGLSTNGTLDDRYLREVINLISFVSMDIKTSREKYNLVVDTKRKYFRHTYENIIENSEFLHFYKQIAVDSKFIGEKFDYEIRTTLYPPLVDIDTIKEIGRFIKEDTRWSLQQFRVDKNMLSDEAQNVIPYDDEMLNNILDVAKTYTKNATLKYV